jgi:hypothetical protein
MNVLLKTSVKNGLRILILLLGAASIATGQSWNSVEGGVDGPVYCFAVYKDELYAGGEFGSAGSLPAENIVRWNGEVWSPVGSGTNGTVRTLFVHDNQLYAGGDFTQCGDAACAYIARWDGMDWSPAGNGLNGPVYAMAEYQRVMYVGGAFTKVGTSTASRIAAWNGTGWQDVTGGLTDTVFALAVTPFNELFADLYAGGAFAQPGPSRVAWLHPAYQAWRAPEWGGFNAQVFSVTYYSGGIVAGGAFTSNTSGSAVNHLALKGNEFYGGVDGDVHALFSIGSDLYVGGSFEGVSKFPQLRSPNIAKWNGNSWEALGSGTTGKVRCIAFYQSALYAGGDFDSAGGKSANHLARWGGTTGLEVERRISEGAATKLENYPNPFNPLTIIKYTVGRAGEAAVGGWELGARNVELKVYDVLGREVAMLVNEGKAPGTYEVKFSVESGSPPNRWRAGASGGDGSRLATGVYLCRLTVGNETRVHRMIFVR